MQDLILNIMNSYGYLGVFFLIALENIFPPIPSEVILLFGGFMVTYTKLNIITMIIVSTLASNIGSFVLYLIGKYINIKKMVTSKFFKLMKIKNKDMDLAITWFNNKGSLTVLFCRFIPLIRSLISIPAGISKMPIIKFFTYTTIGSLIWNTVLIILGYVLGENYKSVLKILDTYSYIVILVLVIIFIVLVYKLIKKHRIKYEKNIYIIK